MIIATISSLPLQVWGELKGGVLIKQEKGGGFPLCTHFFKRYEIKEYSTMGTQISLGILSHRPSLERKKMPFGGDNANFGIEKCCLRSTSDFNARSLIYTARVYSCYCKKQQFFLFIYV